MKIGEGLQNALQCFDVLCYYLLLRVKAQHISIVGY